MPATQQLTFMSFNIHHAKGLDGKVDLGRIAELIDRSGADVVGLQEVDRFVWRSGFQDQPEKLGSALGMQWRFAASVRFGFMQYGNLLLSKFPILHHDVITLKGLGEQRSILTAAIAIGGQIVRVVNTHLGLMPWQRRSQLQILRQRLRELDGPAVLLGDFNMEAEHPLLSQFDDDWSKKPLTLHQATNRYGGEIDHIFVNGGLMQSRSWVEPTLASDHHPVLSNIRMRTHESEFAISQTAN